MAHSRIFDHTAFKPVADKVTVRPSFYSELSDEEVAVKCILPVRPVTSQNNIWSYWDSGWESMPGWRKRTVIDWARRQGPEWSIRVLDSKPGSPWHISRWSSSNLYPKCMLDGSLKHRHAPQHMSDAVRIATVLEHGGIFLDPGLLLFMDLEDICWNRIKDPNDPTELTTGVITDVVGPVVVLQTLVAAMANNPFLRAWQQVYKHVWDAHQNIEGIGADALFYPFPRQTMTKDMLEILGSDITNESLSDYLVHALVAARISCIEDPNPNSVSLSRYWRKHAALIPVQETLPMQTMFAPPGIGCDEPESYRRLSLPFDTGGDSDEEEQRLVRGMVARCSTHSAFYKAVSGIWSNPTLARMWSANPEADQAPGTWAEHLRWARIHVVPQRKLELITPSHVSLRPYKTVWKVGLLEPVNDRTQSYETEL